MLSKAGLWAVIVVLLIIVVTLTLMDDGAVLQEDAIVLQPTLTPTARNYMCDCILTQIPTATPHPFID